MASRKSPASNQSPKQIVRFDIDDYAWLHASQLSEEVDKRQVLEWFVKRVRDGKTVNAAVMEFIAAGVERHLAGKKPWGAKQGIKKRSVEQAMEDAFPIYAAFKRIATEEVRRNNRYDRAYIIVTTAEEFSISEDTVKRAIAAVEKGRETLMGKSLYSALEQYQILLEYLKSPEGKEWLESPEGKEWQKDTEI